MEFRPARAARATRCSPRGCSRGSNRVTADCFVVSHGGVARALMTLIAGVSPQAAENADIWQGRAILFEGGGLRWVGLTITPHPVLREYCSLDRARARCRQRSRRGTRRGRDNRRRIDSRRPSCRSCRRCRRRRDAAAARRGTRACPLSNWSSTENPQGLPLSAWPLIRFSNPKYSFAKSKWQAA